MTYGKSENTWGKVYYSLKKKVTRKKQTLKANIIHNTEKPDNEELKF